MYLQTLRPTVTAVRNVIDKSLAERDANIDKMCTHIDKDIVSLGKEVKEVKQKAQVMLNYKGCFRLIVLQNKNTQKFSCKSLVP